MIKNAKVPAGLATTAADDLGDAVKRVEPGNTFTSFLHSLPFVYPRRKTAPSFSVINAPKPTLVYLMWPAIVGSFARFAMAAAAARVLVFASSSIPRRITAIYTANQRSVVIISPPLNSQRRQKRNKIVNIIYTSGSQTFQREPISKAPRSKQIIYYNLLYRLYFVIGDFNFLHTCKLY